MIIDKNGSLRYVHYGHSMQDIPGNDELIGLLDVLQAEGWYARLKFKKLEWEYEVLLVHDYGW